jgi:hypothetical protein
MFQAAAERRFFRFAEHAMFRTAAEVSGSAPKRPSATRSAADRNIVMFHMAVSLH